MLLNDPFKISPVFEWNYHAQKQIVINQGGTSSGKTYSILQVLLIKACEKPNQIITVVGQDIPNLKSGALRDFQNILDSNDFFRTLIKDENKTERIFTLHNNSKIEFKSFDNEQDAKSGKRDYLFLNEANGIPYSIYDQLQLRTSKQCFLDYNPNAPFWVHDRLIGLDNVEVFISNYKHNPFLNDNIKTKIESYKHTDPEKWKVYGLGKTGKIDGVVFPNVNWIAKMPVKNVQREAYGLDFGYSNDPSTLVHVKLIEGEIYAQCLFYQTGLLNHHICQRFEKLGLKRGHRTGSMIYGDSAEPKSIKTIWNDGWYIKGCAKGKDSINHGIDLIKSYKGLNIVNNEHWKQEQQKYVWKQNKIDGKLINKPIDDWNHIWDALRYGMQGITKIRKNIVSYG